jgi:iron complex transport system substrate-binding protein
LHLALGLVLLTLAAPAQALRVQDDSGVVVELATPARRVVSLAPHLTELVFAAGAADRLVGVSSHSDYPPAARSIEQVAVSGRVNFERLLKLAPDLVLAWHSGNNTRDLERLRGLGLRVFVTEPRRPEDVGRLLRQLGPLLGANTEPAARRFESALAALRQANAGKRTLSVLYAVWDRPLLTVNGEHMISHALSLCGARNAYAEEKLLVPAVSREDLVRRQPDAIVIGGEHGGAERLDIWRREFTMLSAVRANRLGSVNADLIERPGPRIVEGAAQLCSLLDTWRAAR